MTYTAGHGVKSKISNVLFISMSKASIVTSYMQGNTDITGEIDKCPHTKTDIQLVKATHKHTHTHTFTH